MKFCAVVIAGAKEFLDGTVLYQQIVMFQRQHYHF